MTDISDNNTDINLFEFKYDGKIINIRSIEAFAPSAKCKNDENNKIRENIIYAIINNKIPDDYFIMMDWYNLRQVVFNYLDQLSGAPYERVECEHKGGQKYHNDFDITVFYKDGVTKPFKVELKFNASSIKKAPQFSSPMKPSQYMINVHGKSYEEYHYDNYLPQILNPFELPIPEKDIYIKQIGQPKPLCMEKAKELYKTCGDFNKLAKKLSRESITSYIKETELDKELLSKYLKETQQDKVYMLYHNKSFILEHNNMDDYVIDTVQKNATKHRYECTSKNGKKMNVLLRWKNGNGIAFPAFQIS